MTLSRRAFLAAVAALLAMPVPKSPPMTSLLSMCDFESIVFVSILPERTPEMRTLTVHEFADGRVFFPNPDEFLKLPA